VYDDEAFTAIPLGKISPALLPVLKQIIMGLNTRGGTNFSLGMDQGSSAFGININDTIGKDKRSSKSTQTSALKGDGFEKRIIYLTDALPNLVSSV
jgi:hypothetical protein